MIVRMSQAGRWWETAPDNALRAAAGLVDEQPALTLCSFFCGEAAMEARHLPAPRILEDPTNLQSAPKMHFAANTGNAICSTVKSRTHIEQPLGLRELKRHFY
jgi:hypothetical protein